MCNAGAQSFVQIKDRPFVKAYQHCTPANQLSAEEFAQARQDAPECYRQNGQNWETLGLRVQDANAILGVVYVSEEGCSGSDGCKCNRRGGTYNGGDCIGG